MSRPVAFEPWALDVASVLWVFLGGAALIVALYLATRGGRDRREAKETPGKPPVRTYAGVVQSDANPMTVFIILFGVLLLVWAGAYILVTGARGLGY